MRPLPVLPSASPVALAFLLGLSLALGASTASAQQGVRIDRFMPPPTQGDGLAIPTARTIGHVRPAFALVIDYAFQPLVARGSNSGLSGDIVSHRVLANLMAAIGVLDLLEFHLRIPVVFQAGDAPILAGQAFDAPDVATVSDPAIGGSVRIFGEENDTFHLGALVEAFIPLASANSYASDQEFSMRGLILADVALAAITIELAAGASYRPERLVRTFRSASEFHFAAGFRVEAIPSGDLIAELTFSTGLRDDLAFQTGGSSLELILGGRYHFDMGLGIEVGVGIGFLRAPGTPAFRGFFGLRWDDPGAPPPDADGDGFLDADDACPEDAEDVDRFQDDDGCGDPDNDEDGLLDEVDQCVREAEDLDGFDDTDGCLDADDDEDGFLDTDDACPRAPGGAANEGCPATIRVSGPAIVFIRNLDFSAGTSTLGPSNGQLLDELAAVMTFDRSGARWRIVVRPSPNGRRDDGRALAEERAASIIRSLVSRGVDAARVEPAVGDARDDDFVSIETLEGAPAEAPTETPTVEP